MRINEEAGVPKGLYELSSTIAQDIVYFNELTEDEISEMVRYGDEIRRSVEFNGGTVTYHVFYDENTMNKGNADSDSISVNVARLVDAMRDGDDNGIDRAFDEIMTVILHELTHLYSFQQGYRGGKDDHIWLKYNGNLDSEVREFIYCLDQSEMNARVSSSVSLYDRYYMNSDGGFKDVMKKVMADHELRFYILDYVMIHLTEELKYAEGNGDFFKEHMKGSYYGFSLAANDTRLFGGGVKKALRICSKDYASVLRYEIKFYRRIIENYRNKIYKACWNFAVKNNISDEIG